MTVSMVRRVGVGESEFLGAFGVVVEQSADVQADHWAASCKELFDPVTHHSFGGRQPESEVDAEPMPLDVKLGTKHFLQLVVAVPVPSDNNIGPCEHSPSEIKGGAGSIRTDRLRHQDKRRALTQDDLFV